MKRRKNKTRRRISKNPRQRYFDVFISQSMDPSLHRAPFTPGTFCTETTFKEQHELLNINLLRSGVGGQLWVTIATKTQPHKNKHEYANAKNKKHKTPKNVKTQTQKHKHKQKTQKHNAQKHNHVETQTHKTQTQTHKNTNTKRKPAQKQQKHLKTQTHKDTKTQTNKKTNTNTSTNTQNTNTQKHENTMQLTIETSSTLRGQYYSVLHCTTPYYTRYNTVLSVLQSTTQHYSVLHSTTLYYIKTTQYDTPYYKVPWRREKFAFRHSFGRATITFLQEALLRQCEMFAFHPSVQASDEHAATRGLSPDVARQSYPAQKKRSSIFEEQPFSAAFVSSHPHRGQGLAVLLWHAFFERTLSRRFREQV